ncbi:5-hydroxytryptamine receptor 3A-like [Anabas testudineus]|uniref:5-hydroxytryptamine receptor 3A-like n=1 Tax=Anabas testudineus TaxID=64144 RepID=UPI000E4569A3|nr:5-hydroxytryptamine receptor 3A-like [Anabas testudineus]
MLVGLIFLLLLTGGNTEQPTSHDDQQVLNQNFTDITGGNTSSLEERGHTDHQKEEDKKKPVIGTTQVTRVNENCSYEALLQHLNLNKNNEMYTRSRPVRSPKRPTIVYLKMVLYAILDVRETDQTFIPYVWIYTKWLNDHIGWTPDDFCGLKQIIVPTELLWKPDLTIEEMTEKDKAPPSPFLTINHDGFVELRNDQVLTSTCRMQVYKFPFDTQTCTLSFKSITHSWQEIQLQTPHNASKITEWSRQVIRKQYEWDLINVTADNKIDTSFGFKQSIVVYTITMTRRSALYIINFIIPVLFLLCLDFASFLISDTGGEKLSFKITVLLAVTVMQLILNEILPSSSGRIPLVAVYCIGIFALMLISLLETIVVMHLLGKDSETQDNETDKEQSLSEDCADRLEMKKWTGCKCVGDADAEVLPDKEGSSSQLSHALEKVSGDLRKMEKTMSLVSDSSRRDEKKCSYWTRVTKTINKVFFVCYLTVTVLFLIFMSSLWSTAEDN